MAEHDEHEEAKKAREKHAKRKREPFHGDLKGARPPDDLDKQPPQHDEPAPPGWKKKRQA